MSAFTLCGRSTDLLPSSGFSNAQSLIDWFRADLNPRGGVARDEHKNPILEGSLANDRIEKLFRLFDQDCSGNLSRDEIVLAIPRLAATLDMGEGTDFGSTEINALSGALIDLTDQQFLGFKIYQYFSSAGQTDDAAGYFRLDKREFERAIRSLLGNDWLSSQRCLGIRLADGDVVDLLFSLLDQVKRTGGEVGAISVGDWAGAYVALKDACMKPVNTADGIMNLMNAQENERIRRDLESTPMASPSKISPEFVQKVMNYTLGETIKALFQQLIDRLEESLKQIREEIERG